MSNILNLLSQRTVALVGLGALTTVAAYCVYTKRPWTSQKPEQAKPAIDADKTANRKCTISICTTASSDSGVHLSDGFEQPRLQLVDDVSLETDQFNDAQELDAIVDVICSPAVAKTCESVAKDDDVDLVDADVTPVAVEAESVSNDANAAAVVVKSAFKDAALPALTPQFVDARLRVLGNASTDCGGAGGLILVDGDAEVLATRLLSLLGNAAGVVKKDVGAGLVFYLQLTVTLMSSPQRADVLCRSGRLVDALADVYVNPATSVDVEARVRCLLALGAVPHVATTTSDRQRLLAPRLVQDLESVRLRPHALRLLGRLGSACRRELAGTSSALLAQLRRLADVAGDPGGCFAQLSGLLAGLIADPDSRLGLLTQPASGGDFPRPAARWLRRDPGPRAAWLDLLAAVAACGADLTRLWWSSPATVNGTLAGSIRAQLPDLYKQVKKLAGKMKSSEKRSAQGQRLLAVKKEVKALKILAKSKPKKK